jgi:predicted AlkP superfamily pyrophosphatase or phosphodiesterase
MSRLIVLIFCICIAGFTKANSSEPRLVLLSFDGFSYDYLSKYKPKNLIAFAQSGVKSKLLPVYPSKTFPNHLSIITGAYPAHHGIVHNSFFNPVLDKPYSLGAGKNNSAWLTSKTLWSLAEENNVTSAVYFWPESEAIGQGAQPTFNIPFNRVDSEKKRFDKIISWLKLPKSEAPKLIVSYFHSIDEIGHRYGPDSFEIKQAIKELDDLFGDFIKQVNKEYGNNINIVIVSDHGMMSIHEDKIVNYKSVFNSNITQMIEDKSIVLSKSSTQLYLYFDRTKLTALEIDTIHSELMQTQQPNPAKYGIYKKGSYPSHWQFNHNSAVIPDIIIEAPSNGAFSNSAYKSKNKATHGYDVQGKTALTAMFLASGININQGRELKAFENIHVFPFIGELLGLPKLETIDGRVDVLRPIIKNK